MDIKNYQSVVTFLQNYYTSRKSGNSDFSYEVWAKELKSNSRVYLRHIVSGERPINERWLSLFLSFFAFNEVDSEYFTNLVYYSQSKNREQRYLFGRKLLEISAGPEDFVEVRKSYEFLSDKFLPRLQTICSFEDAPQDFVQLAKILNLSETEVSAKIKKLEEIGLLQGAVAIKKDWKVAPANNALGHQEFYRESLKSAEESMKLPFEERKFQALFTALSDIEFQDFLKDFEVFIRQQRSKVDSRTLRGKRLYHMNFNFFPVSNKY